MGHLVCVVCHRWHKKILQFLQIREGEKAHKKPLRLLPSRLYCRLWNLTTSACARGLQRGLFFDTSLSRRKMLALSPPVGNLTLPWRHFYHIKKASQVQGLIIFGSILTYLFHNDGPILVQQNLAAAGPHRPPYRQHWRRWGYEHVHHSWECAELFPHAGA